MNHAVLTILIAGLLPIVCAGIAKWGMKNFDNHQPRLWLAQLQGFRARANAAQANSFEAFPLFAMGMALALYTHVPTAQIVQCGWFFIAMRVLYIYCYVADHATMRSIVWALGLAAVLRLYVLAW
jgi:uncharacterized MAPEG superfamily protein